MSLFPSTSKSKPTPLTPTLTKQRDYLRRRPCSCVRKSKCKIRHRDLQFMKILLADNIVIWFEHYFYRTTSSIVLDEYWIQTCQPRIFFYWRPWLWVENVLAANLNTHPVNHSPTQTHQDQVRLLAFHRCETTNLRRCFNLLYSSLCLDSDKYAHKWIMNTMWNDSLVKITLFWSKNQLWCFVARPSLCQHEDGGRRSMMGDSSKLLTHYHDDAKTMYEVFQRGLHISGGYNGRWSLSLRRSHSFTQLSRELQIYIK